MFLSLHIGFNLISANVACDILDRTYRLNYHSVKIALNIFETDDCFKLITFHFDFVCVALLIVGHDICLFWLICCYFCSANSHV